MVEMPFGTRLGKRKRLRSGRDEMLIPRFSIRLMLVLTTVFAVFFMVMSFAGRGSNAAAAVVSGVLTIGIAFAVYALLFSAAYALARLVRLTRPSEPPSSPFAADRLPPQVIPPQDPE